MEHSPVRGTSRCAPGALSLTAPVFMKPACAKRGLVRTGQHLGGRAWCARRVNYFQASSEPTTSPAPETTRQSSRQPRQHHASTTSSAPHQPHLQHQKPRANQTSSPGNITHTNPHQPHHQRQKPRANQTSSPGNITHQPASTTSPAPETTRQSSQQPRQHHTSTRSNRITNARSQRRRHQRFLYCDGETPNISLKYFAKYFCVPKPTASETSTTLSPASADNSWAALLSRMVRMNTEGFIP